MTKLEKMLKFVSEHNDFYKKIIREHDIKDPLDITQWPILTRKELQENRYDMFSDGYDILYYSKRLLHRNSSGTTGLPINVYWHPEHYIMSTLPLWRMRKKYYQISSTDKRVAFTYGALNENVLNGLKYEYNKNELAIMCSSLCNSHSFNQLISIINDFEPVWLYIQPSMLSNLIFYYNYFGVCPPQSIKYIETVGEILPSSLKEKASAYFHSTVANLYGSEEMNGIAYECPNHHMHILDDNVFVECMTRNGSIDIQGSGAAIITNLNNRAMPLIRYYQGDEVFIDSPQNCLCTNNANTISSIMGRVRNSIFCNGKTITPFILVRIIDLVNNQLNEPIRQYHFDYYSHTQVLVCNLWINEQFSGWSKTIEEAVRQQLIPYGFSKVAVTTTRSSEDNRYLANKNEVLTVHNER